MARKCKNGEFKKKTPEQIALEEYRKNANRHVLVVEVITQLKYVYRIFHDAELLRKAGNKLTAIMVKRMEQLFRTKEYRRLKSLYAKALKDDNESAREAVAEELDALREKYNVTWDYCRKSMELIRVQFGINSIFTLTRAEDIWHGVEKCLFGGGETIHFRKRGDLPSIRAKQNNRGIPISVKNGEIEIRYDRIPFHLTYDPKDRFLSTEIDKMRTYLSNAKDWDTKASNAWVKEKRIIDTFRPCYVTLVPKVIRGKYRLFAHITIEAKATPKLDKAGNPRHSYGQGVVGCDIGTQTIAYTSDAKVELKNLAERGSSISYRERRQRLLNRAMDRSRRATNPENYNEDGTIKKGKKTWKYSKHYFKLRKKYNNLSRINAENRHLAINEDINHIRSIGDVFVTEPKNADKLARRAKKTTRNKKGKYNRKKRFGRSIQNRCPGYFQAQAQKIFESTGGSYHEVPNSYRASQYDHTADDYFKKSLSTRLYNLKDGTSVQRDCYSSFLLYCYNIPQESIDKTRCVNMFPVFIKMEEQKIAAIIHNRLKVMNSGIKVS